MQVVFHLLATQDAVGRLLREPCTRQSRAQQHIRAFGAAACAWPRCGFLQRLLTDGFCQNVILCPKSDTAALSIIAPNRGWYWFKTSVGGVKAWGGWSLCIIVCSIIHKRSFVCFSSGLMDVGLWRSYNTVGGYIYLNISLFKRMFNHKSAYFPCILVLMKQQLTIPLSPAQITELCCSTVLSLQ